MPSIAASLANEDKRPLLHILAPWNKNSAYLPLSLITDVNQYSDMK
jgi:hypothetical protein